MVIKMSRNIKRKGNQELMSQLLLEVIPTGASTASSWIISIDPDDFTRMTRVIEHLHPSFFRVVSARIVSLPMSQGPHKGILSIHQVDEQATVSHDPDVVIPQYHANNKGVLRPYNKGNSFNLTIDSEWRKMIKTNEHIATINVAMMSHTFTGTETMAWIIAEVIFDFK